MYYAFVPEVQEEHYFMEYADGEYVTFVSNMSEK
jgi:hypothetical protein